MWMILFATGTPVIGDKYAPGYALCGFDNEVHNIIHRDSVLQIWWQEIRPFPVGVLNRFDINRFYLLSSQL